MYVGIHPITFIIALQPIIIYFIEMEYDTHTSHTVILKVSELGESYSSLNLLHIAQNTAYWLCSVRYILDNERL